MAYKDHEDKVEEVGGWGKEEQTRRGEKEQGDGIEKEAVILFYIKWRRGLDGCTRWINARSKLTIKIKLVWG